MKRSVLVAIMVCAMIAQAAAEDAPQVQVQPESAAATTSAAERLKANPNDTAAYYAFINESVREILAVMQKDPEAAEKKWEAMKGVLDELKPETAEAKTLLTRGQSTVQALADSIDLARSTLADLAAKVDADAKDLGALTKYHRKAIQQIASLARSQPEQAEKLLQAATSRMEKAMEAADESAKRQVRSLMQSYASLAQTIESGKKMAALIGKNAAPLEVEAWVNGSPLTDADLKGKVVLLDFWAVWCGPCIATFPHLREWQEKYVNQGLVIIGLTRYYNYAWDPAANRVARSAQPVSPEAEQEMLVKFAAQHDLHHRFAVQSKESTTADFYGVTGIPHVVLIDQAGKIRLMRVGSGPQNAEDISQMLEKLLTREPATTGS